MKTGFSRNGNSEAIALFSLVLGRSRINIWSLILPGLLIACASLAEGFSCVLLVPTLNTLGGFEVEAAKNIAERASVFSDYVPTRRDELSLLLIGLILLSVLVRLVCTYGSCLLTVRGVRIFTNELRSVLFERMLLFGKSFFDRISFGHQQEVLTTYVSSLALALSSLQSAVYSVCCLFVYLAILATISWKLTLFVVLTIPVIGLATKGIVNKLRRTSADHATQYNELGRRISSALSNIPLIKAYAAEADEARRFQHVCSHVAALEISLEKKALLISPLQEIGTILMVIAILVFMGSTAYGSRAELAENLVFLLVLKRTSSLLSVIAAAGGALASASGAVMEVLQLASKHNKSISLPGILPCPQPIKYIRFNNVSFSYVPGHEILQNFSIEIRAGEFLGIVGCTGSGKSTILNLLLKFYEPTKGTVSISGFDLNELDTKSWLTTVAYVGQDTYIFHGSIRENLLFGFTHHEPTDADLWNALQKVQLELFVRSLDAGLDTLVGERGVQLSGGERQRLSLARAVLKDAQIWIFDEPTSALDGETERHVQDAIDELLHEKTTIMVTHRLSTLRRADRIIMLENGKIVESGSTAELLANPSRFHTEWRAQGLMLP